MVPPPRTSAWNSRWSLAELFKSLWRMVVLAGLIAVAAMARANAEPRIALIVGNAVYGSVAALENPVNDARLMAETLTDKGFVVTLRANADQVTLNRAIAQFGRDLRTRPEMRQGCSILPGTGCKGLPSAITNH